MGKRYQDTRCDEDLDLCDPAHPSSARMFCPPEAAAAREAKAELG